MHAAIKIISFLVFGAAVATGNGQVLLVGTSLVVPLYFFTENKHLHGALVMLRRLKWLFVSILIVYLFFTPGQLLFPDVLWAPTVEGLTQGMMRIAALVLIVAAVNLLISTTQQEDFLSGVLWCLHPLSFFGLSHERLAIRITLTLEVVSQVRNELTANLSAGRAKEKGPGLSGISETAGRLFESTITTAETATLQEITLPEETRPPVLQWLIPFALLVLFTLIRDIRIGELV